MTTDSGTTDASGTAARSALVVGATGIAGHALTQRLRAQGWDVLGLSRRSTSEVDGVVPLAADLRDPDSLRRALAGRAPTHVFITAWVREATEAQNIETNAGIVRHLLDVVREPRSVRHVALMTGLKHYLGPFEAYGAGEVPDTPFHEDEPRLPYPNFYYAQEDVLFAAAARDGFTWSVHRAHTVIGTAVGNAMNMAQTLAVQAAVCRATGQPFVFPGSQVQWDGLTDMTDASLLAEHLEWAATTPAAADQALNIVNGDVFRWRWLWPRLADVLGVEPVGFEGAPRPLEAQMTGAADVWRSLASEHALVEPDIDRVASWWHTDGDLGRDVECLTDMARSRAAGFTGYRTTLDAFVRVFDELSASGITPPVPPAARG
jgi:nucleoside-diphosphate-sugar epimerase